MKKIFVVFLSFCLLSFSLLSCKKASEKFAIIGDSVNYGNFTITLKDIEQSKGTTYSSPETGNIYVLFKLEVQNNSTEDEYFSSLYFEAYADDCSIESISLVGLAKDGAKSVSGTIAAGKKQIGYVAFEVDKDWEKIELHYQETLKLNKYQQKILNKEKVIFEVTNPKK